ncbi:MAG: D-alanyl-D-alanine carboxypeptidase [Erysipelotrichales bacterium]|nr:D-alanyl-D-alanine carboxypeptidase [Erysipelotrichales bacterium]
MKKYLSFLFIIFGVFMLVANVSAEENGNGEENYDPDIVEHSRSAILIEAETGRVLYRKNDNQRLFPASMTKIATMTLVMEALNSGRINLDTMVTTSKHAASIPGSTILLDENEQMSVEHLLKGVAIGSGNDAATALAEKIGGSERLFVNMMNDHVKNLGLQNTTFQNPTGLSDRNQFSSAHDMAFLSRNLINNHPEILEYTKIYEDWLRKDTDNPFWLVNTNKLVRHYEGIDGLKTGWTEEAGYCLSATIERDGMRLIAVVMGAESAELRNQDIIALIEFGFANFEKRLVTESGHVVTQFNDIRFTRGPVNVVTDRDLYIVKRRSEELKQFEYRFNLDLNRIHELEHTNIGTLEVFYDGRLHDTLTLNLEVPIQRNNVFNIFLSLLRKLFA